MKMSANCAKILYVSSPQMREESMDQKPQNTLPKVVEVVPEAMRTPVYANAFRATFTPYDFEAIFAHVSTTNSVREGEFEARLTARVVLQPVLAKRMLANLKEAVEDYEQQFGEIREVEDDLHGRASSEKE